MTLAIDTTTAPPFASGQSLGAPLAFLSDGVTTSSPNGPAQLDPEAESRRAVRALERRRERAARLVTVGAFAVGTGWAVYFAQLLLVR